MVETAIWAEKESPGVLHKIQPDMVCVWDGHGNATRVVETGHGFHLHRNRWTPEELRATIENMLTNQEMHARLSAASAHMRSEHGPTKAAGLLDQLLN